MNTQKVAITVPKNILDMIDKIGQARGLSRSKIISTILEEKIADERFVYLKNAYDTVFDNDSIKQEQRSTASWFDKAGNEGGQEW